MLAARSTSASRSTIIGSLPPSSSEDGDQPLGRRDRHLATGLGRAGEVDHVDVLDQRRTGRAAAGGNLEDVRRRSALARRVGQHEVGQRCDLARLQDHRVARHQRRDAVAEAVRERVVPRPDHAHDPMRAVAHEHLLAEQQQRVRLDPLVGQVRRAPSWPRSRAHRTRRRARPAARLRASCRSPSRAGRCTRSRFSTNQCRRSSITSPRRSKPSASQAGCASRARSTIASTLSALMSSTWPITSPVAGFSTAICPLVAGGAPFDWAVDSDCSSADIRTSSALLCLGRPSLSRLRSKLAASARWQRSRSIFEGDAWDYSMAGRRSSPGRRAESGARRRSCSRARARR